MNKEEVAQAELQSKSQILLSEIVSLNFF